MVDLFGEEILLWGNNKVPVGHRTPMRKICNRIADVLTLKSRFGFLQCF